jgi:hypothetical protein
VSHYLMDVTPVPGIPHHYRAHDGMLGFMEVLRRVSVRSRSNRRGRTAPPGVHMTGHGLVLSLSVQRRKENVADLSLAVKLNFLSLDGRGMR